MGSIELHELGKGIFAAFSQLSGVHDIASRPVKQRLLSEEQRFRLWGHSLGLQNQGHSSLDYRVRDAIAVKSRLGDVLTEVKEQLDNLVSVQSGDRQPFEIAASATADAEDGTSDRDSDARSMDIASTSSSLSSDGTSFYEVDFRLKSIEEAVDALYSLATKIRNPRNRPQRTVDELYKHVPADMRKDVIQEREEGAIATICHLQRQELLIVLQDGQLRDLGLDQLDILGRYASPSNWLVRRAGIANARRKQQFVYWKEHADRISRGPISSAPPPRSDKRRHNGSTAADNKDPLRMSDYASRGDVPTQLDTLATSATRLDETFIELDDLNSVISQQSRVSTVMNLRGENLHWPSPPVQTTSSSFFTCPYCKIICPHKYLAKEAWRVHLAHDLQPYHCTFEHCTDANRIYETRQEWLEHESLHMRVWHCFMHAEEFETQPEYIAHLRNKHSEQSAECFSSELIAAAVGPSTRLNRDCPFCPTTFYDTSALQKHITFHLERLALFALPEYDDNGMEDSERASDSHEGQRRGRVGSAANDFTDEEQRLFADSFGSAASEQPQPKKLLADIHQSVSQREEGVFLSKWLADSSGDTDPFHPAEEPHQHYPATPNISQEGYYSERQKAPVQELFPRPPPNQETMDTHSPQPLAMDVNSAQVPDIFQVPEILVEPASEPTRLGDVVRDDGLRLLEQMKLRRGVQVYQDVLPAPASLHKYLDQSLRHALRKCDGDEGKYFMPIDHLDRIISRDTISIYLSSMRQDRISNRLEEIATYICGERGKVQEAHTGKRVFASLILARKADTVVSFYDESIYDEDLPLVRTDEVGTSFNLARKDSKAAFRLFSEWTNGEIELFDMYQRFMKCPFFAQDNDSKPLHYVFSLGIIFPWIEYGRRVHSSSTSEVRPVNLHPAQRDLPPKGNHFFALKTLKSDDSKEFQLEVNALKKILPHTNLVTPLATFYYKEEYHLLFPWAEGGNLMQLWKSHPNPSIDIGLMLWFADQCCGLARGLSGIHNTRMPKSESAVPLDRKKSHEGDGNKDCGRHGDIKPQNILWFTQKHNPGHGTLKISDFGLTAFHSELTTKVFPDKIRGLTQTYAAPEYDIGPHISRPYDIWSLGCMFIEFVTWILLGFEGVETFTSKRMKDRSFNSKFHLDDFYRLSEGIFRWPRKGNAVVKRSVQNWIHHLLKQPACSQYLKDLLNYIADHMILVVASDRHDCNQVIDNLCELQGKCQKSAQYCVGGSQRR